MSPTHLPPVRSACTPVAVQFTKLETDHLPARETREQEISSYKRTAKVRPLQHTVFSAAHSFRCLHSVHMQSDTHVLMTSKALLPTFSKFSLRLQALQQCALSRDHNVGTGPMNIASPQSYPECTSPTPFPCLHACLQHRRPRHQMIMWTCQSGNHCSSKTRVTPCTDQATTERLSMPTPRHWRSTPACLCAMPTELPAI